MQQAYRQCQHGRIVASEKLFYVAICRHTLIKTTTSQKPNPKSEKILRNFESDCKVTENPDIRAIMPCPLLNYLTNVA